MSKTYFISDIHLGLPDYKSSLEREKKLVKWLDMASKDASAIYLMGDVFDFWWEWKRVVPAGFYRFLGKICEITDSGIPVHFFTGNHDIWVFDFLPHETGVILHRKPEVKTIGNKKFYLAHGDGLGPHDRFYKLLKRIFTNKFLQWCFSRLHPNFAIGLARLWSHKSRASQSAPKYHGTDKEWLILHAKEILKSQKIDYFVFGHRHLALNIEIGDSSRFVNLGDWIGQFTYAVFDGNEIALRKY